MSVTAISGDIRMELHVDCWVDWCTEWEMDSSLHPDPIHLHGRIRACAIHEAIVYSGENITGRHAHGNSRWVAKRRRRHLCEFAYVLSCEQCCGSATFWCGSGSGSCYFHHWPSRRQQKTNLKIFFSKLFFEVTFTSFSKIRSQKEVIKR